MEKGENVKSGALEVILAGNLSYHSDLVKALQQGRGKRERGRERGRGRERAEVFCLSVLVLDRTFFFLNVAVDSTTTGLWRKHTINSLTAEH